MITPRLFHSSEFLQPVDGEPVRSVVTESNNAVVVAWYVQPHQTILPHIHPQGQDTWTILSGKGDYFLDEAGATIAIAAGDIVIAPTGCVHGVTNQGEEPLIFISVVSPADAGYQQVSLEDALAIDR